MLESFGQRLQYSVFECYLRQEQVLRLKAKVEALLNLEEDSLIYFPLCAACHQRIEHLGVRKAPPVDEITYVV